MKTKSANNAKVFTGSKWWNIIERKGKTTKTAWQQEVQAILKGQNQAISITQAAEQAGQFENFKKKKGW